MKGVKRAVTRLPTDPQLSLFSSLAEPTGERERGEQGPVRFVEGEAEGLRIGAHTLEGFLRQMGERRALVVREVLDALDFSALEAHYAPRGRRAYSPRRMVGLVLYGLLVGVTSLRELEALARRDLGCMWACAGVTPDHSVLGRFVCRHRDELNEYLVSALTAEVLRRTDSGTTRLAGDGTVVEAAASRFRRLSEESLAHEETLSPRVRERLEQRRVKGKPQETLKVAPSEPEAMFQKLKDGRHGYSYKASVLANEARVVVGQALDPSHEVAVLGPMLDQAERQGELDEVLLDAGYHADAMLEEALRRELSVLCPDGRADHHDRAAWRRRDGAVYAKHRFVYDAERDGYHCPAGQWMTPRTTYHHPTQGYVEYATSACEGCSLHAQCTSCAAGRRIRRRRADEAKEALAEVMGHPRARRVYQRRKAMVEPVFSVLRALQGLNRFRRRGLAGVRVEFTLHVMAYNLGRVLALTKPPAGPWKALQRAWAWLIARTANLLARGDITRRYAHRSFAALRFAA